MAKFKISTKCVIGEVRFSYLNANQPKSINNGPARYSVSIIISKDNVKAINEVKRAIKAAYEEGAAKLKGNGKSALLLTPFVHLCTMVIKKNRMPCLLEFVFY